MISITTEAEGLFKLEAVTLSPDGREISRRVLADWFPNIITDQGLDKMGDNDNWMNYCQVGSGNTTPTALDTSLVARIAGTSAFTDRSSGAQATAPYFGWAQKTFRFGAGAAAGNIAEVAVGWASSGANIYNRALVLDGDGLPTTVTVLSDEALDVTFQHRVYPPLVDVTGTIDINGTPYDYTVRACNVTRGMVVSGSGANAEYGWGLGVNFLGEIDGADARLFHAWATSGVINASITGGPSGTFNEASSKTDNAYSAGSLSRSASIVFGLTNANFAGGIAAFRIGYNWATYQVGFSPKIPKDGTNNLSMAFSHSWARH
jgi:hypothetical protein